MRADRAIQVVVRCGYADREEATVADVEADQDLAALRDRWRSLAIWRGRSTGDLWAIVGDDMLSAPTGEELDGKIRARMGVR